MYVLIKSVLITLISPKYAEHDFIFIWFGAAAAAAAQQPSNGTLGKMTTP
jgi:hypothetical protein